MKKNIKVSIIVPVYNAENTLHSCIESIISQEYDNIELLLIDDGSTDNSLKICKLYEKRYSNIKTFTQKNSGVSSARNFGIDHCTSQWVTFIDSDDIIEKNFISEFVKTLSNNSADLYCFNANYIINNYKSKMKDFLVTNNMEYNVEDVIKQMYFLSTSNFYGENIRTVWAKFYKTDIIKKNFIRFSKKLVLGEDAAFNFSYLNYSKSIYFCNKHVYNYLVSPTSIVGRYKEKMSDYQEKEFYELFNNVISNRKISNLVIISFWLQSFKDYINNEYKSTVSFNEKCCRIKEYLNGDNIIKYRKKWYLLGLKGFAYQILSSSLFFRTFIFLYFKYKCHNK